jgi:hypothetical protein
LAGASRVYWRSMPYANTCVQCVEMHDHAARTCGWVMRSAHQEHPNSCSCVLLWARSYAAAIATYSCPAPTATHQAR